jgi:alkyl hydroperoxide reductase subunit D
MGIQEFRDSLPEYAKDVKLNLGRVLTASGTDGLSQSQIYAVALASAYATKHPEVISVVAHEAASTLSEAEVVAAKGAASLMAMNNVYYRFVHLVSDPEFGKLPAQLRMNFMANPGVEKLDFELMSLAVSAINGCGMCIDSHVHEVMKAGVSKAGVQSIIRIASVVNSAAQVACIEAQG